ncbi:DUF3293 domain-containing protein [Rhodovarius sp.]|uniref:DUF3293 domain-containing protein n=1 Tax=Rhodovarius sp. TaxID=2972673 RepID=UPI0034A2C02D
MRPALERVFRASAYHVDGRLLRVGRRPLWPGPPAVLLTAHNPHSRRHPPGWNARMLRALDAALRRNPWREAESGQGAWLEIQRLVEMDARAGLVLARRFRQNAVLVLKRHQPPILVILVRAP